jgi:putative hydrolase
MVGVLAQSTLGRYDLPLPVADEPSLVFVAENIDNFTSQWSLERTDTRLYVALHEVTHAAIRSVPWVRERMVRLAEEYVRAYSIDPSVIESEFGNLDPSDPSSFAEASANPMALLGAIRTPGQVEILSRLQCNAAVIEGYADRVLEHTGRTLIPSFDQIHEALNRHRLERGEAGRFIEGLLGLDLQREHYELGTAFSTGVIERAGLTGLNRLWEREAMMPTPAELEAPGLWLARIEFMDD